MKLLPTEDVLKLSKEELKEYINELNNAYMDLDFEYKAFYHKAISTFEYLKKDLHIVIEDKFYQFKLYSNETKNQGDDNIGK